MTGDAAQLALLLLFTAAMVVVFHVAAEVVVRWHRRSVVRNPGAWRLDQWDRFTRVLVGVFDGIFAVVVFVTGLVEYRGVRIW